MHKFTTLALILCGMIAMAVASETFNELDEESLPDPRFLIVNANGTLLPINGQLLLAALGLLSTMALFGIGLWLLLGTLGSRITVSTMDIEDMEDLEVDATTDTTATPIPITKPEPGPADPYSAIWEKMSVLDWIAMMEEMYRKFDATSMECQQRLVCELHQNENTWGTTARKMNDAFSYLQYLELLNLPTEVRVLLDDYLEAANKGRTSQETCEDMYKGCEFSVKSLISKYNGSNAI